MARTPKHIDVLTPDGVTRVRVTYRRPYTQIVPVRFCFLHTSGIQHACDEMGCWPDAAWQEDWEAP